MRNGYNRPSNTIPRQNKPNWATVQWQMQQQQQPPPPHAMNYTVHMIDANQMHAQHKSVATGSESGSSTGGDMSPPPPPPQQQQTVTVGGDSIGMHGGNSNQSQSSGLRNKQALNLNRLNGGNATTSNSPQLHQSLSNNNLDFNGTPTNPNTTTIVTSNSSGNLLLIGGQMHSFPTYRSLPGTTSHQRQFPTQVNGEISIYPFIAGAPQFIPTQPQQVIIPPTTQQQRVSPSQTPPNVLLPVATPFPTSKLVQSCFNCGSINHTGLNCSEASMEDVTRNAVYKLDYTVSTQSPSQFQMMPVMTTSSSGNINNNQMQGGSIQTTANNSEPEPSITFIDLTQDTSSDSSISNR